MHLKPRRGIALVIVLLVVVAVAAIAAGASFLGLNTQLIAKYHNRLSMLESVADAGLEQARSALNASKALYPDTGYVVYENAVDVTDAAGSKIPGVKRSTYVGPTGITSGQYGVFGSVVTVVQDANGNRIVRRAETAQESFAKFAYFTDVEGAIVFGKNDVLYGPVFSNDNIQLEAVAAGTGATFFGTVRTAQTITSRASGDYRANPKYIENVPAVPFPTVADLNKLKTQATIGGTALTSSTLGDEGQATMRIEFVAVDLNGDGRADGPDEGFMKVYTAKSPLTAAGAAWVVATPPASSAAMQTSANCGHVSATGTGSHTFFKKFASHASGSTQDKAGWAINNGTSRNCYLGGSDILNDGTTPPGKFLATDSYGSWLPWTGAVDSRVTTARPDDAAYLWPISRALNPNFKGVIHVTGKVAISGVVRGKITLAATGNIIIADNITYVTNPGGTVPCNSAVRDILGIFSGNDVIIANNLLNAPWTSSGGTGSGARTWANRSGDEFVQGVVLALSNFTAQSYNTGSQTAEKCEGADAGRGCLYLTGGVIQYQRGAVGLTSGEGYIKRYQYDACAGANPPPYFPTTGHFAKGHYYEVEPTNFNITTYWQSLTP